MNTAVLLKPPAKRWACPACATTAVTQESRPHTEMHHCRGTYGLLVPMVEVDGLELRKHQAVHRVNEREDFVGTEKVRLRADGKPAFTVVTEHADGHTDCTVYAPTAHRQHATT